MADIILPFKQDDIYMGLAEINGLLRVVNNVLEIEYKVKDTTLGLMDSSVKSCHIPLKIIDSIEVEKKWFSVRFELVFNRIPDLDNPFQLEQNRLVLKVKKENFDRAHSFRSRLMYGILENKLDHLDEEEVPEPKSRPGKRKETPPKRKPEEESGGLRNMLREE